MVDEPTYILWARTLPPDQWERWRQLADLYREFHETSLDVALESVCETMQEETSPASNGPQPAVYAVLDIETGSRSPKTGAIGSVAVMTLDSKYREVTRYHRLVADEPDRIWTREAIAVNGLDPARLRREGTPIAQLMADLKAGLPGKTVVAHNARFDLRFLHARGITVPEWICTLELARKLLPGGSHELGAVADRLGVPKGKAHDAIGDVETTANVFRELMRRSQR